MSETPQADAGQGNGGSGPARPQSPPPLPLRPPGVPEQPSAWTRPAPADGPGGSPRGGPGRVLLTGGAVALVVAVVVGVVIFMSGGDGDTPAGTPSAAPPAASSRKAFSEVPAGCELVRPSTVEAIVPAGVCTPGLMDDKNMETMITRMPSWQGKGFDGPYRKLRANLLVGPAAEGMYDAHRQTALKDVDGLRKVLDSRPVDGLGEDAVVVYSSGELGESLAQIQVIVREGNATVTVDFTYDQEDSPMSQQQAEEAAVAAACDVLASLS